MENNTLYTAHLANGTIWTILFRDTKSLLRVKNRVNSFSAFVLFYFVHYLKLNPSRTRYFQNFTEKKHLGHYVGSLSNRISLVLFLFFVSF